MEPFVRVTGIAAPLNRVNVDTDAIIPKQFLKRVERSGFGQFLFFDWRFLPDGSENPEFVLNDPRFREATLLLSGPNFGCGSSREHAAWALLDYGIRAVIAPSFADIFYNNCFKNGILPVTLPEDQVNDLMARAQRGVSLTVDLEQQVVESADGARYPFEIDPFRRKMLLEGLDDIGLTLTHEAQIAAYEARRNADPLSVFAR
ncbi:MAG: 3-isopropylmalate dehydratase small subunit [Alicyclobacillus sp.]|nr:3-isopropylmalate dehydratase small subunit [Alicyclobacillus sp.]